MITTNHFVRIQCLPRRQSDNQLHLNRSDIVRSLRAAVQERPAESAEADAEEEKKKNKLNFGGIVAVNPKPRKGFDAKAIDFVENVIVKLMYDSSSQPFHYHSGNFAPVSDETPPTTDLPVTGRLPDCLNGEFVRVGPNSQSAPVAGYHWFDGDGLIHGLRIKDGKATYVSRFVSTSRFKQEKFFGGAKFIKFGDLKGLFGLLMVNMQNLRERLKVLDVSYGVGTASDLYIPRHYRGSVSSCNCPENIPADLQQFELSIASLFDTFIAYVSVCNTALVYHDGKLLALSEIDKPYVLKVLEDGDLQTLGMLDYDKRLQHSFTAHPKIDPYTGEMFTFGSSQTPPYLTYRVISKDGFMHDPVPITISDPMMMHDFAITENYAVFMDLPLYFRQKEMVKENKHIYSFDPTIKARFGVLPRYAKDEFQIKWFELPNCYIFHNANAWEEDDEVVLITCRIANPDRDLLNGPVKEKPVNSAIELYEMKFNMKTGLASQKKLSAPSVDFPRIHERYTGRKQRYVYGAIVDSIVKVTGIIKFDLHADPEAGKTKLEVGGNVKGIFDLGPGRFGTEAVFVPREPTAAAEEDDGYLIFFVHDENTGKSSVNIIDAKTMSADPIAVVELPRRVPYGFHGFFVKEEQLQELAKL
ncbi:hypothetical protein JRO89_XS05G0151500 [Xanthoceras sorbifolium]|uniref:carotenoid 9,10-dioxygenase n=1 Tax=Xanthoceras sorbifolium TaxID=99658 RepID=A0ABQ8I2H7_9ROSI|nr:hypothetical protein JRO89_XS05G0151500 [Xanthoceras sorbifolium]